MKIWTIERRGFDYNDLPEVVGHFLKEETARAVMYDTWHHDYESRLDRYPQLIATVQATKVNEPEKYARGSIGEDWVDRLMRQSDQLLAMDFETWKTESWGFWPGKCEYEYAIFEDEVNEE